MSKRSMKKLYRSMINGRQYYCWSTSPKLALKFLSVQSLRLYGKYTITELYVREREYEWKKIQLTTRLLQQCCGHS